ncbi:hypothetical protein [Bertelyvirus sp.]|nr:hypothetical protein [Bertelyvirus sp.]
MLKPQASSRRARLAPASIPIIPADIALVGAVIPAGSPAGTLVGTLSALPAAGDYEFTLLDSAGGRFAIQGSALVAGATPSAGGENPTITVRTTAAFSRLTFDKTFSIAVQTVVAPITLSPTNPTVAENTAAGVTVASISSPGATLSLTDNAGGRFAISGTNLVTGATATNYEVATSHDVTIRTEYNGDVTTKTVTVQVSNVVEITNITLAASSIPENSAAGVVVGQLASVPPGAALTLTDSAGSRFAIDGSNRLVAGSVATDYETNTTHDVSVRATQGPDVYNKTFTISVTNVNELTDITLSANSIAENSAAGVVVGNLASVIPGASFAVTGQTPSGTYFTVNGSNQLVTGATATNFEVNASHSVTVTATKGTDTFQKTFTINVSNQTEITDISLSNASINEGVAQGTAVGTLSSTPTGATFSLAPTNPAGTRFQVSGTTLQQGATPNDREATPTVTVKIRGTRQSETFDKDFVITINNVVELTDFTLSGLTIDENAVQGTPVGTLSSTPTGATYTLNDNAGGRFQLVAGAIQAGAVATDFDTATSHDIIVTASRGGETMQKTFTITVNDLGD